MPYSLNSNGISRHKSFVMIKFPSCYSQLCRDIKLLCCDRVFPLSACFMSRHNFEMSQHKFTLFLRLCRNSLLPLLGGSLQLCCDIILLCRNIILLCRDIILLCRDILSVVLINLCHNNKILCRDIVPSAFCCGYHSNKFLYHDIAFLPCYALF